MPANFMCLNQSVRDQLKLCESFLIEYLQWGTASDIFTNAMGPFSWINCFDVKDSRLITSEIDVVLSCSELSN